jgi:hypothetical protein
MVGAGLTLVAVALACLLKEVPLRSSNRAASDLSAEEAAANGTGAEAIIEPEPAPPRR